MSEPRWLFVTPKEVRFRKVMPSRRVGLEVNLDEAESGLLGIGLVLEMSPEEARQIAQQLLDTAREVEGGSSPTH